MNLLCDEAGTSLENVLLEPDVLICIDESDDAQACREAEGRKEVMALAEVAEAETVELMASALPSSPPSPPPMGADGEFSKPTSTSSRDLPMGHELEAGEDGREQADLDVTDATNDYPTALARSIPPLGEFEILAWKVRMCQTPEINPPTLPQQDRSLLSTFVTIERQATHDMVYLVCLSKLLRRESAEDYTAWVLTYLQRTMNTLCRSSWVAWVELRQINYRGVIQVRVMHCTRKFAPGAGAVGLTLSETTYRRLLSSICSVSPPTRLREEFRSGNRHELGAAARRRQAAEGGGGSSR
eukprot:6199461-Pleurochrysis_carterae.AAC.3